jgi:PIN domain nuclease of toxin-antitoxin system
MRILLDTCTLLWWWTKAKKLSPRALSLLRDPANQFLVSPASAWEVATKHRIGKFPEASNLIAQWAERLAVDGFQELPITSAHALRAGGLLGEHRDPFDRMLAAQGILEGMDVMTNDGALAGLGVGVVW